MEKSRVYSYGYSGTDVVVTIIGKSRIAPGRVHVASCTTPKALMEFLLECSVIPMEMDNTAPIIYA